MTTTYERFGLVSESVPASGDPAHRLHAYDGCNQSNGKSQLIPASGDQLDWPHCTKPGCAKWEGKE